MEIAFTKNGWVDIKTDKTFSFGDIAVDFYNTLYKEMYYISKILRHDLNITINPCFIDGRDAPRCDSQIQIFESDSNITAIIWSEHMLQNNFNLKYTFDGSNPYYNGKNLYYIPLYENYLLELFEANRFYLLLLEKHWAFESVLKLIEFVGLHEDRPFYTEKKYHDFTMKVLENQIISFQLKTELRKYKGIYIRVYVVEDLQQLLYDDIIQMIDFKYSLDECPICHNYYVKRDKRRNFCSKCSNDKKTKKKYNDQKRKSDPQYLHKKITDMLRNRQENYLTFVEESHYYADLVSGKAVERNPQYNKNIKTEVDYRKWLEQKHEEYMKRKR